MNAPPQPPARAKDSELDELLPGQMPGIRDVVIVVIALLVLALVALLVVYHYKDGKDAVAALGVGAPAISTIAAAAFGIAVGSTAGAAAGKAGAKAARSETEHKRQQATQAQIADRRQTLSGLTERSRSCPARQVTTAT